MMIGGGDVAMAAVILGITSGTLISLARIFTRRLETRDKARAMPSNVDERLLRIEQAVDAIAIEVERMSESQRFTSKVLAERLPPAALTAGEERGR